MSVPMRIEDLENMLSRSPKTTPSRLNGNQARNIRREKAEAPGGGGGALSRTLPGCTPSVSGDLHVTESVVCSRACPGQVVEGATWVDAEPESDFILFRSEK